MVVVVIGLMQKTTWEKFSIMLLPGRRFMSEPEFINRQ